MIFAADIVKSLPDFIRFFFSHRRRNTLLLRIYARISWVLELIVKLPVRILIPLKILYISETREIVLNRFPTPYKYRNYCSCDLHPRWSRDNFETYFDSTNEVKRKIFSIR